MIDDYDVIKLRHPHIAQRIKWAWGHPAFYIYIDQLLTDSRTPPRKGFDRDILIAIMNVIAAHDKQCPQLIPSPPAPFDESTTWGLL